MEVEELEDRLMDTIAGRWCAVGKYTDPPEATGEMENSMRRSSPRSRRKVQRLKLHTT